MWPSAKASEREASEVRRLCPLPELGANQPGLLGDVTEGLPLGISLQQLWGGGDLQIPGCGLQHQGHTESPSLLLQDILCPVKISYA